MAVIISACNQDPDPDPVVYDDTPYTLDFGTFPPPTAQAANLLTAQKIVLGRMLFYETKLSSNLTQACADCHRQEHAFTDTAQFSVGAEGDIGGRQAMAIFNMAWHSYGFFWDGRAPELHDQATQPIQNPVEMNETIPVAVLDNAIAIDHVDLAANVYTNSAESGGLSLLDDDFNGFADDVNGYDVSDNDNNPRPPGNGDGFAHGTHVAGIVGAVTNNGSGIASLGYSCTILPVKIASNSNGSALNGSIDGIFYAMQSGADVINMSWGVQTDAATLRTVIAQAAADGIVLVAAAGNDGNQNLHYPAAYSEVISVGSTNQNDQLSAFSNFGSTIDLVAPGEGIYSTLPQGNNTYGDLSGTSMAAPLVAALASLVKAEFPSFNRIQIQQRMEQGCDDISAQNPGQNGQYGLGESMFFKP